MDESAHRNKPEPGTPTPEVAQLLKMLDIQTAALRKDRATREPKRLEGLKALQGDSFRYGSLILIVVFALGSVAAMEWMLSKLPKPVEGNAKPAASVQGAGNGKPALKN